MYLCIIFRQFSTEINNLPSYTLWLRICTNIVAIEKMF